jgi:hypothetical protein
MNTLQTYITQVQRLVHDASNANFLNPELTDYINEAREDVALDMHCVRTFYTGVQLLPGQEIYSIEGAIVGANVTAGGNYVTAPTVTFDPAPAGGVTATGTAVLTGGAVTAINMTAWGDDYVTAPNITFNPPGAAATPIFFNNVFQIISVSNIWNDERYMLSYRGFTLFQAYFRSWTTLFNSRPGVWTFHQQMLQAYLRPPPDQLYLSEWDVLSLPTPLVNLTDVDTQVIPPWNKAVQFRAAALALMKNQNFEQAQFYESKYDQRVPKYIIGSGGIRIPNPYNRSFQRRVSRG